MAITCDESGNGDIATASTDPYQENFQTRIPKFSEANPNSSTVNNLSTPSSNLCHPENAKRPRFKKGRRFDISSRPLEILESEPETMSLPEFLLSGQNTRIDTPLAARSSLFEMPTFKSPTAPKRPSQDIKFPSQVSLPMTDPHAKSDTPGQRQRPSRFWGKEPAPLELDIGQELDDNAPIWEKYCEEARLYDRSMTEGWNSDMDMLLVFAALFSAILTAFIIEFYKELQSDNSDLMVNALTNIVTAVQCIANSTVCNLDNSQSSPKTTDGSSIFRWILTLWFTSLTLSLSVSSIAILVKQWIHAYYTGLKGQHKTYATLRQFRFSGMQKWRMSSIVSVLPSVMYLAVALFFAGLLLLLSRLDEVAYLVALGITVSTALVYVVTTIIPIIDPSCPFRTPAAGFFGAVAQVLPHYISLFCYSILRIFLLAWEPIWSRGLFSSIRVIRFLACRTYSLQTHVTNFSFRKFRINSFRDREREVILSDSMALNAQVLVWLSNAGDTDTQEILTQALAGLDCETATTELESFVNVIHWTASRLTEMFNNYDPSRDSSYHYKLALYAQGFIMAGLREMYFPMEPKEAQMVCNALQWYPALVPLGWLTSSSPLPTETVRQAIYELGAAITIMTGDDLDSSAFQIILDLLLQASLSLYLLYQDQSAILSRVSETVFETLQVWMIQHQVLDKWPRPCYLLTLCSTIQVFTGTTQPSDFRILMSTTGKNRSRETWLLLLRNLLSMPTNLEEGEQEDQSRHWRFLCYALSDCSSLLEDNRVALDLALNLFSRSTLASDDPHIKSQLDCLHLMGPFLTPSDTHSVVMSFERPWGFTTGRQLCLFLQNRCENIDQAKMVLGSEVLTYLLDHLFINNTQDGSALGCLCTLLQTLTKNLRPEILSAIRTHKILETVNKALLFKVEALPWESWDYYRDWHVAFKLAPTCYCLYRMQDDHVFSSGILFTLHHLCKEISSRPGFFERREFRKFIQTVMKLQLPCGGEDGKCPD